MKKNEALARWLLNPHHTSINETATLKVKDLEVFFLAAWEDHLEKAGLRHLLPMLDISISSPLKNAAQQHIYGSIHTDIIFEVSKLSEYPGLFNNYASSAPLPFYMVHEEDADGRLYVSFNPYLWEDPNACQAMQFAEFRLLSKLASMKRLPADWKKEFFNKQGLLVFDLHIVQELTVEVCDDCAELH